MLCEIFCVACGLFSFIKGERERERERERAFYHQFLFGAFIFAPSKAKKRRKMDGQPSPLLHRALSHPHHRLQYYLSISISRAQTRPRVPRVPSESHDARTVFAEFRPSFSVGRLRVNTVRKAFSFLFPRCFSRSKIDDILIQSALMMTQKCAHRSPVFWSTRPTRPTRDSKKSTNSTFHAR